MLKPLETREGRIFAWLGTRHIHTDISTYRLNRSNGQFIENLLPWKISNFEKQPKSKKIKKIKECEKIQKNPKNPKKYTKKYEKSIKKI